MTDNLAATPADYDPYCISRANRFAIAGRRWLSSLRPLRHQPEPVRSGRQCRDAGVALRGVDAVIGFRERQLQCAVRVRPGFAGGLDTGRSVNDNCFVIDSPQQLLNCRVVTPFKALTDLKLNGSYPLPGEFMVAGVFQNVSGPAIGADYAVSTTEIAPSLGRNLAACGTRVVCTATATVPLRRPQTEFEDRRTQSTCD